MSGHPLLTTNVYIGIAVAFLSMMVYWFFYNRSVRSKEARKSTGNLPPGEQDVLTGSTAVRDSRANINSKS